MPTTDDFTIAFLGQEPVTRSGQSWTRYRYNVNMPRPRIPVVASIWPKVPRVNSTVPGISFVTKQKRSLAAFYGGKRNNVPTWFFELSADVIPPSWVRLVVSSPPATRAFKSNFAETTL